MGGKVAPYKHSVQLVNRDIAQLRVIRNKRPIKIGLYIEMNVLNTQQEIEHFLLLECTICQIEL